MKHSEIIEEKIFDLPRLLQRVRQIRLTGKTIAFTNGCFDILHRGHIASLSEAAATADFLIVALNSDASAKRLKGDNRPVNDELSRAIIMASLVVVDAVILFDDDTPLELITAIVPDVLIKGGDYTIDRVVGAKEVIAAGGKVVINPIVPGFSTTGLIEKILKL